MSSGEAARGTAAPEGPAPAPRVSGMSLAIKLAVATGALVILSVGAAAFYSVRTITDLKRREVEGRRVEGRQSTQQASELLTRNTATSAAIHLADGNYTALADLVAATVAEDHRIEWLLIADEVSGRVVARSAGAPPLEQLDDPLRTQVSALPSDKVISVADARDPTKFVFAAKAQVGDRAVGQVRMGVSTRELEDRLNQSIRETEKRAQAALVRVALVAGVILLLGIFLAAWEGVRMAGPLHLLAEQAARIAGGEFHHRVEVRGGDEIGRLGDSFNNMAERLGVLLEEMKQKALLEREMELAREVQMSMVPPSRLLSHGPFRVIGHTEAATFCGGDWWTVRRLPSGRLVLVVGDVTGHGMPAAMIAASARGAVEGLSEVDESFISAEKVLLAIDAAIRNIGGRRLMMTCFSAIVDPKNGAMEYANAGHNFPYLLHVDRTRTLSNVSVLAARGNPLGAETDRLIQSGRQMLVAGDVLLCFTDGVIDRVNRVGERFGERRLRKAVLHRQVGFAEADLTSLHEHLLGQLTGFAAGHPPDDDVTFVLCQFEPAAVAGTLRRGATGTG